MTNQKINNTQVLIGQPIDYPTELMLLMENIFNLDGGIKKAYLACIQYANPKILPKILIGLEVDGGFEKIISNISTYMQSNNIDQVEFTDAENGEFKSYFSKIKPFYYRKI